MTASSVNIEVSKGPNENNLSVLRRFQKRVQAAGILPRVRSKRYSDRDKSKNIKRVKTIAYIKRKEEIAELVKAGKMNEITKFSRRK